MHQQKQTQQQEQQQQQAVALATNSKAITSEHVRELAAHNRRRRVLPEGDLGLGVGAQVSREALVKLDALQRSEGLEEKHEWQSVFQTKICFRMCTEVQQPFVEAHKLKAHNRRRCVPPQGDLGLGVCAQVSREVLVELDAL